MGILRSRRKALALSIGWWMLRRKLRKRTSAALAGLVAARDSVQPGRKRRGRLVRVARRALVALGLAGGGLVAWKKLRGGAAHVEPQAEAAPVDSAAVAQPAPDDALTTP